MTPHGPREWREADEWICLLCAVLTVALVWGMASIQ